ncbi:MAG: hypothetical protein K2Y22_16315 [Candidatus Obscuribacterales bacterium]|nr:hypothetical protein [Candidatus Obscuribacterales bacterium]
MKKLGLGKLISLALVVQVSAPAFAAQTPSGNKAMPGFEHINTPSEINIDGLDILVDTEQHKPKNAVLRVRINVQYNKNPQDKLTAYPYPVKPPELKARTEPLPTNDGQIKDYLMQCCYNNRRSKEYAYPMFGFRWEHALEAAQKRTGESVPHSIFTVYPWIHKMVPYVKTQCERINAEENARMMRYAQVLHEYNQKHSDLENESARHGIDPVQITIDKNGEGFAEVQAGAWWIAGSRKVPGLTLFWSQPVTVAPAETSGVLLNEGNAIFIGGGW